LLMMFPNHGNVVTRRKINRIDYLRNSIFCSNHVELLLNSTQYKSLTET
jgi:hypothetical protein